MARKIFVSSYFSGDEQKRKINFFEAMDRCLEGAGYRIVLFNVGQKPAESTCETDPPFGALVLVGRQLNRHRLPPSAMASDPS